MKDAPRYRLDDLRRLGSALLAKAGVAPARASAMATQLLWFDAAGAPTFGIATLPAWLERLGAGAVDPAATGSVATERAGTAVLDGRDGPGPLILARAGEIASEKARELGLGLVRVVRIGPTGPAAAVAAELAIGPFAAFAIGPGASWTLALPSDNGLPAVFDAAFDGGSARVAERVLPGLGLLVPEGGWLVGAISVTAIEPLATLQERVGAAIGRDGDGPGRLAPAAWEAHRRAARERGVAVAPSAWKALAQWAGRFEVEPPVPCPR